jgi:hypothetical protein
VELNGVQEVKVEVDGGPEVNAGQEVELEVNIVQGLEVDGGLRLEVNGRRRRVGDNVL